MSGLLDVGYIGPREAAKPQGVPPQLVEGLLSLNQFVPVSGDIQSGVMAANEFRQGNIGNGLLVSLGALPLVPMITKAHIDSLLTAIRNAGGKGSFGLRVIPGEATKAVNIGDVLQPSYQWKNGEQTARRLRGTSTIGVSQEKESLEKGLGLLGIGKQDGPYYFGDQVVLVQGTNRGRGSDPSERVIENAKVIWKAMKANKGRSDLIE